MRIEQSEVLIATPNEQMPAVLVTPTQTEVNQIYKQMFCPDLQAVAQTVLEALEGDPAIIPAHGTPLVQVGDAARLRALVEPLTRSVAS